MSLTDKERSERARKAGRVRWRKWHEAKAEIEARTKRKKGTMTGG